MYVCMYVYIYVYIYVNCKVISSLQFALVIPESGDKNTGSRYINFNQKLRCSLSIKLKV